MPNNKITDTRDAYWTAFHEIWAKNRCVYEGGEPFKKAYIKRHKAETSSDYDKRVSYCYNPGIGVSAVNSIINSIVSGFQGIKRSGNPEYMDWANKSVGGHNVPMTLFMGKHVLPELSISGQCYVMMDSDGISPYCYTIKREDVYSVVEDKGEVISILYKLCVPTKNEYGLYSGYEENVNHVYINDLGQVTVSIYNEDGKEINRLDIPIDENPVKVAKVSQALLNNVADMEISMLNLASSDVDFLVRSNFPVYTEQYDPKNEEFLRRSAEQNHSGAREQALSDQYRRDNPPPWENPITQGRVSGNGTGIRYPQGLERPDFINPSPDCVKVSIEKQEQIENTIAKSLNNSIASISHSALVQSGVSKAMDQVEKMSFVEYISYILEQLDVDISNLYYKYTGKVGNPSVVYPIYEDNGVEENTSTIDYSGDNENV